MKAEALQYSEGLLSKYIVLKLLKTKLCRLLVNHGLWLQRHHIMQESGLLLDLVSL